MVLYFILVIQHFFFYYGSYEVASGILCDGLYKLDLDLNYPFFLIMSLLLLDLNVLVMNFL